MAAAYLTPTKPLNPSSVLTPSKSVGRLEPIALPWTPQWNQERAATPGLQKPEIMGDALTFLNKRTKRQQIMNNVKAFKDETTKFISEQKEAGTPVPILREAIVETVKGLSVHPDISVAQDDAVAPHLPRLGASCRPCPSTRSGEATPSRWRSSSSMHV